jgi:hypothetical protein
MDQLLQHPTTPPGPRHENPAMTYALVT